MKLRFNREFWIWRWHWRWRRRIKWLMVGLVINRLGPWYQFLRNRKAGRLSTTINSLSSPSQIPNPSPKSRSQIQVPNPSPKSQIFCFSLGQLPFSRVLTLLGCIICEAGKQRHVSSTTCVPSISYEHKQNRWFLD